MPQLSRRHYDLISRLSPALLKEINQRAAREPNPDMPLIMEEGIDPSAEQFLRHEMGNFGRRVLSDWGYDVAGMPDDLVIGRMPDSDRQKMWVGLRQNFIHILNFVRFGRKTFYFQGNLVSRLAETELNVDNELVEPPFRSCMFVYDDQIIRDAFYALSGLPVPDVGAITVYLSKIKRPYGEILVMYASHTLGNDCPAAIVRQVLVAPGKLVEDALRTDWDEEAKKRGETVPVPLVGCTNTEDFYTSGHRFFRIVLNSILYLNSAHPDLSGMITPLQSAQISTLKGPARRTLEQQIAQQSRLEYIHVGRSVPPLESVPLDPKTGRPLDHQVRVRGHYKLQAHGPSHSLRKPIRIEPYWKGPDTAEVISKPYFVT